MKALGDLQERIAPEVEPYETMDPPEAEDLGVKVHDLPPARQRLARFVAWVASIEKQLADIEAGRARLLEQLGINLVTEQTIDKLVQEDKTSLLGWLRSAGKLTKPVAREFEHAQLREKLAADTHTAEVAREALATAEDDILIATRRLEILKARRDKFVNLALIEFAASAGSRYMTAIKNLETAIEPLAGLASVVGGSSFHSGDATFQAAMPKFALPGIPGSTDPITGKWLGDGRPQVSVSEKRVEAASLPWKALAKAWARDPRAKPPTGV